MPSISTSSTLPTAKTSLSYSTTIEAFGGTAPYSYAVTGGTLPAGLVLGTASGIVKDGGCDCAEGVGNCGRDCAEGVGNCGRDCAEGVGNGGRGALAMDGMGAGTGVSAGERMPPEFSGRVGSELLDTAGTALLALAADTGG